MTFKKSLVINTSDIAESTQSESKNTDSSRLRVVTVENYITVRSQLLPGVSNNPLSTSPARKTGYKHENYWSHWRHGAAEDDGYSLLTSLAAVTRE